MPKRRGRPAGRGKPVRAQRPVRELRLSDRLMRDARSLPGLPDVLAVEDWASGWLGDAWLDSVSEHQFHMEVVGRAGRPSPHGLAALAALRRLAAPAQHPLLDGTLKILAESQPLPPWFDVPAGHL